MIHSTKKMTMTASMPPEFGRSAHVMPFVLVYVPINAYCAIS